MGLSFAEAKLQRGNEEVSVPCINRLFEFQYKHSSGESYDLLSAQLTPLEKRFLGPLRLRKV